MTMWMRYVGLLAAVLFVPAGRLGATAQTALAVSGNPGALAVSTATAGSQPDAVSDATTSYDVQTDVVADIAVKVSPGLPGSVTLSIELAAPASATSLGAITLTTLDQDAVTGIPASTNVTGLAITYRLSATAAAGVVTAANYTVTLSLLDAGDNVLQSTTQTVNAEVQSIKALSVSSPGPSLTVNSAVAGSEPTPADDVGTYAITVNAASSRITGSVSPELPTGVTLSANLDAAGGGSSQGLTALGTAAVDLVTGIGPVASSGLSLLLRLAATVAAGPVAASTFTVTYTIVSP